MTDGSSPSLPAPPTDTLFSLPHVRAGTLVRGVTLLVGRARGALLRTGAGNQGLFALCLRPGRCVVGLLCCEQVREVFF